MICFWKAWDSRISNMTFPCIKCKIHKNTNTQIRKYTNTKCLKDPTCAIFLKSMEFKDINYSNVKYTNKQIHKYANTKIKVLKRPNMCSSTTLTQCWPSSSGMESGRGQLVHQQHHPASFCRLRRSGWILQKGGTMLPSADWQTFLPITITKRLKWKITSLFHQTPMGKVFRWGRKPVSWPPTMWIEC